MEDGKQPLVLTPARPNLLRDQVVAAIRAAILEGRVKAGEWLNEEEFCRQLGVSRSPFREALRQLEQEGLVVAVPHRGAMVARLTRRDAQELYGLRAALESYAAEQLAARGGSLAELQALVDAMAAARAAGEARDLVELDLQFHARLCELSGNSLLARTHRGLIDRIRLLYHVAGLPITQHRDYPERHQHIVDAIASADPHRIAQVVRAHLDDAAQDVARRLES